jgi:TP901 family phage tail tape measure protein
LTTNDHTIDVKVRADTTGLSKGLSDAEQSLSQAGKGFSKYGEAVGAAGKTTQGFVEKNKDNMQSVGKDAMIMGGAILAGIGLAVHAYSEFAGRMAQVQSLSHASAAEMGVLTTSALTLGTAFGLSANDVADAEIELVKAGVSVKDMMGGALTGALALAAAGQIDVGKATEIATIAMTQFGLAGKDMPHVADLLTAGADKALGGVSDLGDALKQGGLVASQFGLTIDETVGTLSAFANAGLLGSDAGTSLKTMFNQLASPSKQAADAMAQVGINAYDTQGKFIGVTALAGQLHDKLLPLTDAQRNYTLSQVFGTDAMRAASVLMKEGSTGIQKWISDVNAQGFAALQAGGKMDSLSGDFKKLQASFETGLIKMGAASDGFLRPVIQGITNAITAFSNISPQWQGLIMSISGVAGAGLLLGGAFLTAAPKIYDSVKAFEALKDASPKTASAIGKVGKAAGIAAAALVALQAANTLFTEKGSKSAEDYGQALLGFGKGDTSGLDAAFNSWDKFAGQGPGIKDLAGAVKEIVNPHIPAGVQDTLDGLFGWTGSAKNDLGQVRDRLSGLGESMGNLVKSGSPELAAKAFKQLSDEFEKNGKTGTDALSYVPGYRDALKGMSTDMHVNLNDQELMDLALGKIPQKMLDAQNSTEGQAKMAEVAAKATEAQAKALDAVGIAADGTILNLDKLVQSMINSGLIALSARDAARNFEKSIDDLDDSLKKNGTTLDITTQKGRDNQAAFDGIAGAGLKSAEAMAKAGESQEAVQGNLRGTYDSLIAAAGKFGITGDEADTMARKVMGVPKNVPIDTAIQNFADSMAKLQAINDKANGLNGKRVDVGIYTTEYFDTLDRRSAPAATDPNKLGGHYADGGALDSAPGPKGVDSKLFWGAKGEHVLTDNDVDAMGGQAAVYAFRKQLHDGGVRPSYGAPASSAPAAIGGFGNSGPVAMSGTLVLDSGELMGTFTGVANRVADAKLEQVSRQVGGMRR